MAQGQLQILQQRLLQQQQQQPGGVGLVQQEDQQQQQQAGASVQKLSSWAPPVNGVPEGLLQQLAAAGGAGGAEGLAGLLGRFEGDVMYQQGGQQQQQQQGPPGLWDTSQHPGGVGNGFGSGGT
jgi:hypothetical protein